MTYKNIKKLILMRHAESPSNSIFESDFDRNISKNGRMQALQTSNYLLDLKIKLDKVVCSPALRTKKTWDILQKNGINSTEIDYKKHIYNASEDLLIEVIEQQDNTINNLLILAHNPGISALSFIASKNNSEFSHFSPATCMVLEYNAEILWRDIILSQPNKHDIFIPKKK